MSTPFSLDLAAFPGADPGVPIFWRVGEHRLWLGQPGNMIQLPSVSPDNYTVTRSQGEVAQGLFGGGTAVTMFDSMTRTWGLMWPLLAGRDWSVVNGFYRRLFGDDPWCYLQPEDLNHLTLAQSLCGALNGAVEGWDVTAGTLTYDNTVTPVLQPGGVLRWAGAGSGSILVAADVAAGVPTPDPDVSCPYIPAEAHTPQLWAWTATGTASAKLRASGRLGNGTVSTEVDGPTVTLGTTPQLLSVTAHPGELGASIYVLPELVCGTASAPNILVSNAAFGYEDGPRDWEAGGGLPRVEWVTGSDRPVGQHMVTMGATMTLAEAVDGAA